MLFDFLLELFEFFELAPPEAKLSNWVKITALKK